MEQRHENEEDNFDGPLDYILERIKHLPKNYITVVNMPRYREAEAAMEHIKKFFEEICDEEEVPTYKSEYDTIEGTALCFDIVLREFGAWSVAFQLKSLMRFIPDDCVIDIVPQEDQQCCISLTFPNIRKVVANLDGEEKEN